MIYITGDCHGDWSRFSTKRFLEQKEMTRKDYVIVCGDFGIWKDTPSERWWLDWLEKKNFTLLFVDGNHENFDRLNSEEFPEVDYLGGRANKIRENVYHLKRGYVFNIDSQKVFAMGGAKSQDINDGVLEPSDFRRKKDMNHTYNKMLRRGKRVRLNHYTWWKEEEITEEDYNRAVRSLDTVKWKVDFIVTHCAPTAMTYYLLGPHAEYEKSRGYLDTIHKNLTFKQWFLGHYHQESYISLYNVMYKRIVRIN